MSIKDVARLAGVAPSTVSRVINSGNISAASPETRERIWAAARELGYIPNQNARSLRITEPETAPVVHRVDCIFARVVGYTVDYFFEQLMHEIRAELMRGGFQLGSICNLQDIMEDGIPADHGEGAAILGRVDEDQLNILRRHYKHIVSVSLQDRDSSVDQVISRGYDAIVTAVEYLHSLGHRKICYLGEVTNEQRYEAYLHSMEQIGVPKSELLVVDADFSPASGYGAAKELLARNQPFTAILCANDMLALGVLKALNEHRLRVPRDVSLIGINDKEDVRYLDPMLTAVNIPIDEIGRHAAKLLIDRVGGGHKLPVKLMLPNKLIVRESCGPAKRTL